MRKQYFWWTYLVGCIVCVVYGGWTLIYHLRKGNGLSIHALVLLIIGSVLLIIFLILYLYSLIQKRKCKKQEPLELSQEEPIKVINEEHVEESSETPKDIDESPRVITPSNDDVEYVSSRPVSRKPSPRSRDGSAYIKEVGVGLILRVDGDRIYDMRSNTYYRIQGNMVNQEGRGPVFEINGNRIRIAFGSYLYEISGGNVNKVFGGYFASISGGRITKHDLSVIYEIDGSLDLVQQLTVVALLFGAY